MATLADAQTERDKIKAAKAKQDYEKLLSEVIKQADADCFFQTQQQVCADHLRDLTKMMVDAVGNEKDETRIHYLLSDCAIDWLRDLGNAVEAASGEKMAFAGKAFKRTSKPRDLLTVSQWAERYRVIESGSNAPGKWDNMRAPHAVEIMDSLSEHSPIRTVTFLKASGVSGTEVLLNWIGYNIHHVQKDMMMVVPTLELRDRTFNPKLDKLFRETPVLAEMINTKSRATSNRQDLTEIGTMRLIKSGANSPDSLRAEHIPYVAADEIDAFPWDVGGEGDPKTLIENRQKTFSRAKSLYVSTPTTDGTSHIEQSFLEGDQRHRLVPCPHCGHFHELEMKHFHYKTSVESENLKKKQVTDAYFACPECGGIIEEGMKNDMLEQGRWVPRQPSVKNHRSFKITSFYIKFGLGLTWKQIAQKWVDSQGDTSKLKAFANTYLAESWKDNETGLEAHVLMTRLESFPMDPMALVTVAGVDVQKDRLEITIAKFSLDEQCWVVDHLLLFGDPLQNEVWDELAETMDRFKVQVACIDSGYLPDRIHQFCESRAWCFPTKGEDGAHRTVVEDERKRMNKLRYRRKRGRIQEIIGTHQAKLLVFARLQMPQAGDGYIHYPNNGNFDDGYFNQLTAERLVTKLKAGKSMMVWEKKQERNEALDCIVLCLAAFRLAPTLKTVKLKMQRIYDVDPVTGEALSVIETNQPKAKRRRWV
jgi:phage terminase large subunit GpA-like protein